MPYVDLTPDWEVTETDEGQTAVRVFGERADGSLSLPDLGDEVDPAYPSCVLVARKRKKWGGHPDKEIITLQYESPGINGTNPDDDIDPDTPDQFLPRQGNGSAKIEPMTVHGQQGEGVWYSTTDPIDKPVYRRTVSHTLTIPKQYDDFGDLLDLIETHTGKLNAATFEARDAKKWLYSGCRHEERRTSAGGTVWQAWHSFELIGGDAPSWNHEFNAKTGAWAEVDFDASGASPVFKYGTAAFGDIIDTDYRGTPQ